MFRRLWADDAGSVIATEYVLLAGLVTFGAAAGLVEVRNAVNANLRDVGQSIRAVGVSPTDVRRMVHTPAYPEAVPTTAAVVAAPPCVPPAPAP